MELNFQNSRFEKEVRDRLGIYNRAITVEDARKVQKLDLSDIYLSEGDVETLFFFENLRMLEIDYIKVENAAFWNHFPMIEELFWEFPGGEEQIDFEIFSSMSHLQYLYLSGGGCSNTRLVNLEALIPLKALESLHFCEFGTVDIAPLEKMMQLKYFGMEYPDDVENLDVLTRMDWLEEILLYAISGEKT